MIGLGAGLWRVGVKAALSLEDQILALGGALWLEASETYAKAKVAVETNGTDEYFTVDDVLGVDGISEPTFSLSFWLEKTDTDNVILFHSGNASTYFQIAVNNANVLVQRVSSGQTASKDYNSLLSISGGFDHIVVTYDGSRASSGIELYFNGSLQVESASGSGTPAILPLETTNYLCSDSAGATVFGGKLDQFVPFDKELNGTEASDLYNSDDGLLEGDLSGSETFYSNIVGWYDFNAIHNFGKEYNNPTDALNINSFGMSVPDSVIDGTDLDFETSDDFSLGCWVNFNAISGTQEIMEKIDGSFFGWWFILNNGFLRMDVRGASGTIVQTQNSATIGAGTWYHIWTQYDSLAGTVKLFIDGSEVASTDSGSGLAGSMQNTADFFFKSNTNAVVDQAQIYNAVVAPPYNGGTPLKYADSNQTNLIAHWDFDEQDIDIIGMDKTSNNYDLNDGGSATEAKLVSGKDGKDMTEVGIDSSNSTTGYIEGTAAGFDNVSKWIDRSNSTNNAVQLTAAEEPTWYSADYVQFNLSKNLDTEAVIDLSGDFTIVIRSKHSDLTDAGNLITTSAVAVSNDGTGKTNSLGVTATNAIPDNNYNTVVVRYNDGTSTLDFRLNGAANGSFGSVSNTLTSANLQIGDSTIAQLWDVKGIYVQAALLSDDDVELIENRFALL